MPLLPGRGAVLTQPETARVPPPPIEAWAARPAARRNLWKTRPRTPQLLGQAPVSAPRRLWSDLQHHSGTWRRWLPLRWNAGRTNVIVLGPRDTETARLTQNEPDRSTLILSPRSPRPRLEREAAAVLMGVDVRTYDMMLDLQYRDITPEDYDTLRRLDTSVKPKTLSRSSLEKHAPRWRVIDDPGGFAEQKSCCICIECFVEGDSVRTLPCKHNFHAKCIDRWLLQCSDCCPEDSLPVVPEAGA